MMQLEQQATLHPMLNMQLRRMCKASISQPSSSSQTIGWGERLASDPLARYGLLMCWVVTYSSASTVAMLRYQALLLGVPGRPSGCALPEVSVRPGFEPHGTVRGSALSPQASYSTFLHTAAVATVGTTLTAWLAVTYYTGQGSRAHLDWSQGCDQDLEQA